MTLICIAADIDMVPLGDVVTKTEQTRHRDMYMYNSKTGGRTDTSIRLLFLLLGITLSVTGGFMDGCNKAKTH